MGGGVCGRLLGESVSATNTKCSKGDKGQFDKHWDVSPFGGRGFE